MSYESSPSAALVATHCACCARPLADAVSAEIGMGPSCRKKHGYAAAQGEANWPAVVALVTPHLTALALPDDWQGDQRRAANLLVHRVAVHQDGAAAMAACDAIRALGFTTLASRVSARMATVELREEDGGPRMSGPHLVIDAPYNEAILAIPGRRWDNEAHVHRVHLPAEPARLKLVKACIMRALTNAFPGAVVQGPKGLFVLPLA